MDRARVRVVKERRDQFIGKGWDRGVFIELKGVRDPESFRWAWTVTHSLRRLDRAVTISSQADKSWLSQRLDTEAVELGDDAFDAVAWMQGDPALLRAMLTARTRRQLEALLRRGARLSEKTLTVPFATEESRPRVVADHVLAGAGLVRRMAVPEDGIARRLGDVVRRDPVQEVRARALVALLEHHPGELPEDLVDEELLGPVLSELRPEALLVVLPVLAQLGTPAVLSSLAPLQRFPVGTAATREAARGATEAILERHQRTGALTVAGEADGGELSIATEAGGLAEVE